MSEQNLAEVTTGMRAADEGAFDVFYDLYFPRLYRVSLVMTRGNEELAQDVLQETMLRIINYIKVFTDEHIFWNWLVRLLRTAFIDEMRKKKTMFSLPSQIAESTEDGRQTAQWLAMLDEVVDELSDDERRLVLGKYIYGKSYETLATESHTTAKAIESKLTRIRKKMRRKLLEKLANV